MRGAFGRSVGGRGARGREEEAGGRDDGGWEVEGVGGAGESIRAFFNAGSPVEGTPLA
jgi:hypothetical protein